MSRTRKYLRGSALCGTLLCFAAAHAQSSDQGNAPVQLEWNARLRHEQVDDAAYSPHAYADTLRLRLGLRAQVGHGWSYFIESAGTASADDHYNSGANGQVAYPAITDPKGAELNQAWLVWQGDALSAKVGRQEVVLNNQRWVGNVAWRQFEQTFDAVALQWKPASRWSLRYDWLERVNRVAGPDAVSTLARARRINTHLLNAGWNAGRQQITGYAYLHKDKDVSTASTATYGVRWVGNALAGRGFGWSVEGAHQYDYANNPQNVSHNYWLVEPSWTQWNVTGKLGWESLGGNGHTALQTPLATLHAFNGWDDQFTVTPANGLQDRYITLNGNVGRYKLGWVVSYHDYRSDRGSLHYGSEWDASLSLPLSHGLNAMLKAADYQADHFGHDDTKLWLQLEWVGKRAL